MTKEELAASQQRAADVSQKLVGKPGMLAESLLAGLLFVAIEIARDLKDIKEKVQA